MVKKEEVFRQISAPLYGLAMSYASGRIYLFGSLLSDSYSISDVDILVVYEMESELVEIKTRLLDLEIQAPLDVICMTSREERYLRFVERQKAVPVDIFCNPAYINSVGCNA